MPEALGGAGSPAVAEGIAALHDAVGVLLARTQQAGAVRDDIGVVDVVALLKGLLAAVDGSADPGLPQRLLAVIRDGLRRQERPPRVGELFAGPADEAWEADRDRVDQRPRDPWT